MKKNFLICLFVVVGALSAHSQAPYKHSIGGIVGFINGGSYKTFVANNFAVQVDFGLWVHPRFIGANVNANFMYEQAIKNGFYWFVGGGVSLGTISGNYYFDDDYYDDDYYYRHPHYYPSRAVGFKFGFNAIGGAEYKFANIPLTLQADIRPGVLFGIFRGDFYPDFTYDFLNISARFAF